MSQTVRIGIIGDFDQKKPSHPATNAAIEHAASRLSIKVKIDWLPTSPLERTPGLERFDGLWASSGSPYQSIEGALNAIRLARESGRPFIGT